MNIAGQLLERLAEWGDKSAIREPNGRTTSYADLRRKIIGFANTLKARGFQRGDAAVIQAPTGAAFTIASVAVGLLGGVMVLCEPGFGDEMYVGRLRAARSNWALVHPIVLWANRIPGARRLLRRRGIAVPPVLGEAELRRVVLSDRVLSAAMGAEAPVEDVEGRTDLAILFTGGTTSEPKGVRISHDYVAHFMTNIASFARDAGPRGLIADNPQQVLFGLMFGHEVFVIRGNVAKKATAVEALIREGKASAYFGAPYLWTELLDRARPEGDRLPPTLRALFLGGAPVTPTFLRRLSGWLSAETKVTTIYGATEAGPVTSATAEEKLAWDGDGDLVGRIVPGTDVTIGEDGEIIVKGPGLFNGYLGRPEISPAEGFATGDLGRLDDRKGERVLVLLGRAKDMIIRAGVNIYPSTLEPGIRAIADASGNPLLREAALIGLWSDTAQDEVVVLCWQKRANAAVDEGDLARRVAAVTGDNARPDYMLEVDPFPIVGRLNKIDKPALRRLAAERLSLRTAPPSQRG